MGAAHTKNPKTGDGKKSLSLAEINARVDHVSVDGVSKTKNDIIMKTVAENDLFKANTFAEMLERSQTIKNKLDSLECFKEVYVQVDTSSGPKATPDYGYEVTFVVQEQKPTANIHTTIGTDNEGLITACAKVPNMFGRAEKLLTEFSYGNKQTKNFNITFSKPLLTKSNACVGVSIFVQDQEWSMSKYKLGETGARLDLSFFSLDNLKHSFQWEGTMREINVGNRFAAFEVRENAGSTLKSCLKHILKFDSRKSFILPSSGTLVKLTSELAGVGGNVGFLKNDGILQLNLPLMTSDFVLQASMGGGFLVPMQTDKKSVGVCDNFFLGGPMTFRGFEMRGASPSIDGTFVGAKMYWCAGLSLFTPLPFRPSVGGFGENLRTHFFANAGSVSNFNVANGWPALLHQTRLAYGVGLAIKLGGIARLEINYCFPTYVIEGDRAVHGVQIGLGLGD